MLSLLAASVLLPQVTIRVACVGDSITHGYGLPDETRTQRNYPGRLQLRLGLKYEVKEFGHTGSTLMNLNWLPPLMKTEEYKQAVAYKPDVVVLMGGTNDGVPRNWEHASQFPTDLKMIVKSFKDLPSHPKVYLMLPPRLCTKAEGGLADDAHSHNVNQGIPPIFRAFASANKLPLIDSRVAITSRDCYTPDGIHLTEKGCAKLANQVASVLLKKQTAGK